MKGKSKFSEADSRTIRKLLLQKSRERSAGQKQLRDQLRAIGFYISDFTSSKKGFRVEDFDMLVTAGRVKIFK